MFHSSNDGISLSSNNPIFGVSSRLPWVLTCYLLSYLLTHILFPHFHQDWIRFLLRYIFSYIPNVEGMDHKSYISTPGPITFVNVRLKRLLPVTKHTVSLCLYFWFFLWNFLREIENGNAVKRMGRKEAIDAVPWAKRPLICFPFYISERAEKVPYKEGDYWKTLCYYTSHSSFFNLFTCFISAFPS